MILDHSVEVFGAAVFAIAILHTFVAGRILHFSHRFPRGSGSRTLFHLLGEVELVFVFWAAILTMIFAIWQGSAFALQYQTSLSFTEPIFVFCIMVLAATRPILQAVESLISFCSGSFSKISGLPKLHSDFLMILILGPLAGSLITEPAAMTLTALLLSSRIQKSSGKFIYFLLGTVFVNISIGGALTSFAAPPILMVAGKWGWDTSHVFTHFGWKSFAAVVLNSALFIGLNFKILPEVSHQVKTSERKFVPIWVTLLHLGFLAALVMAAHQPQIAVGVFLLFFGLTVVTKSFQDRLRFRESLLVAVFLAGIVMFGPFQRWWLEPLLTGLNHWILYAVATALTAVTDNAALTYLGSQVDGLSSVSQYYLVAGAIAGGGLTIIANAPNAAGYSVLQRFFPEGLRPLALFLGALLPTLVALIFLSVF